MTRGNILVISESASDAEVVVELLEREFSGVTSCCQPDRFPRQFESRRPDVVILCMRSTHAAEHHYLGILRRSASAKEKLHRTILLCTQEEADKAYRLCKDQYFDEYVLFWPVGNDAHRLHLSAYQALRHVGAAEAGDIETGIFAARVKSIGERVENHGNPATSELRNQTDAGATPDRDSSGAPLVHLVDDDPLQHKLTRHALTGSGYRFSGSMSGSEFTDQLNREVPAVILMDFEMPETDGITLVRRIRGDAKTSHVPVLMLTGHSTREVAFASLEAGAVDFVVKPFKKDVIIEKIKRCLTENEVRV